MEQSAPDLDPLLRRSRARARPVLPQGIKHDLADRPAGLPRQRARQLCGFGVADVDLILHGCFLCLECRQARGTCVPKAAAAQLLISTTVHSGSTPPSIALAPTPAASDTSPMRTQAA